MGCFIAPAAEAVITTVATKAVKTNEKETEAKKIPFSRKLKWLSNLLWGGSALLAFEHVWHGELAPWFPFLTAAENPVDFAEMLHEMATTGVTMAAVVTVVWAGMLAAVSVFEKREGVTQPVKK